MVVITLIRVSGLMLNGTTDDVWGTFFLILAAEVGIILAAATSFRAFFISRQRSDIERVRRPPANQTHWYCQRRSLLRRTFTARLWRSMSKGQSTPAAYEADDDHNAGHYPKINLSEFPRAHMTGVRTFIDGLRVTRDTSRAMESQATQEDTDKDTWPLHIRVQNVISQTITSQTLRSQA